MPFWDSSVVARLRWCGSQKCLAVSEQIVRCQLAGNLIHLLVHAGFLGSQLHDLCTQARAVSFEKR
jgi:hypothetical protein